MSRVQKFDTQHEREHWEGCTPGDMTFSDKTEMWNSHFNALDALDQKDRLVAAQQEEIDNLKKATRESRAANENYDRVPFSLTRPSLC